MQHDKARVRMGYRDSMYDAEKIKFFAERIIAQLQYTKADES